MLLRESAACWRNSANSIIFIPNMFCPKAILVQLTAYDFNQSGELLRVSNPNLDLQAKPWVYLSTRRDYVTQRSMVGNDDK